MSRLWSAFARRILDLKPQYIPKPVSSPNMSHVPSISGLEIIASSEGWKKREWAWAQRSDGSKEECSPDQNIGSTYGFTCKETCSWNVPINYNDYITLYNDLSIIAMLGSPASLWKPAAAPAVPIGIRQQMDSNHASPERELELKIIEYLQQLAVSLAFVTSASESNQRKSLRAKTSSKIGAVEWEHNLHCPEVLREARCSREAKHRLRFQEALVQIGVQRRILLQCCLDVLHFSTETIILAAWTFCGTSSQTEFHFVVMAPIRAVPRGRFVATKLCCRWAGNHQASGTTGRRIPALALGLTKVAKTSRKDPAHRIMGTKKWSSDPSQAPPSPCMRYLPCLPGTSDAHDTSPWPCDLK